MTQCTNEEIGRLIAQYELGELSDEECDRFEEHLMECDFCLGELEQMRPIVSALRQDRVEIRDALRHEGISFETLKEELLSRSRVNRSVFGKVMQAATQALSSLRQTRVLIPAISMLFALVLIRMYYWPPHIGTSETNPYERILTFESLPYQLLELRGTAGEADPSFDEGMKAYLEGNYGDAIVNLRNAVEKAPENGSWWLYLGVCYYLERDAKAAVKALARADTLAQFSDKTRARWYLAQAHLLNGDANQAIPLLQWLIDQEKTYAGKADSLLRIVQSKQTLEQKGATPK